MTLSTKVFEYAAMGKPVVASRLPMVERTFPPGTVATYEPGDAEGMAAAILALADDPPGREAAVARMRDVVRDAAWEREAERYVAIVERLARHLARERSRRGRHGPQLRLFLGLAPRRVLLVDADDLRRLALDDDLALLDAASPGCSTRSPSSCRG